MRDKKPLLSEEAKAFLAGFLCASSCFAGFLIVEGTLVYTWGRSALAFLEGLKTLI